MNRPVFYVDQKEDLEKGTFWWTVVGVVAESLGVAS
ncbi:hypothetical protein SEA_TOOTSIEROLL_67 [Mycobacterium phage Tootsieroll]|nr:hypothetical protein SEA_TOOTSIEROLL_67 [Mycobacterium phage Tootsieroll]